MIELRNVSQDVRRSPVAGGRDFAVNRGEIVGLLGDNGAGKSTLVKTVMGFHRPDPGGEIYFHGKRVDDWSVASARSLGIETVYQERALCEKQPIWRNMFMGREPRTRWGLLDVKRMRAEFARLMSEHMGFTSAAVHPDNVVTTMSGGEKQGVAITRALHFEAELVILDEPTMGLSLSRDQEDARLRRAHQGGGQIGDLHRPQHLQRLSGRRPALCARSRQGRRRLRPRARSRWTS